MIPKLEELNIGDTFINSYNNLTTIRDLNPIRKQIKLESEPGTVWYIYYKELKDRLNSNTYTDYKPIESTINIEVKDFKEGDYYYCQTKKGDFGIYKWGYYSLISYDTYKSKIINHFRNKKPTITNKDWHFLTRKATADEIEWLEQCKKENKFINKSEILNNKTNETIREITTDNRREKTSTAISSSIKRQITVASQYIGNAICNRIKKTRIGESKVSFSAIGS